MTRWTSEADKVRLVKEAEEDRAKLKEEVRIRLEYKKERFRQRAEELRAQMQLRVQARKDKLAAKKAALTIHRVYAKKPGPKPVKVKKTRHPAIIKDKEGKEVLARLDHRHDGMIDDILANPKISVGDLAEKYGCSKSYIRICIHSDRFLDRMKDRRAELVNPLLSASLDHRLRAIAHSSSEKLLDELEGTPTPDFLLKTWVEAIKFQGYGQKAQVNINAGQGSLVNILSGLPSSGDTLERPTEGS